MADHELVSSLVKRHPAICTVEQARDYLEWHVQNGRGKHNFLMRGHWACIPPEHSTHDDDEQAVFMQGLF